MYNCKMSRPPECMYKVSEKLSEVMDDIGVNERLVMKRRRAGLLMENIRTFRSNIHIETQIYQFGSQTEGSTIRGLHSDKDTLISYKSINVIQNMSEWKEGVDTLKIIHTENLSPGYCYLQFIKQYQPILATTDSITNYCVPDNNGRLLLKNTYIKHKECCDNPHITLQMHGPAFTKPAIHGFSAHDIVHSFYSKSPHQATSWLHKQKVGKWPTEDVIADCRNAGCFVVPVGSKVHSPDILESELEWRISTSLQERYLMFSLNIPQLMCYILMKVILKTHIDPYVDDILSSFMCKNVLLYCIANSSHDWHAGNLLSHLHLCLFMLKECVKQRNCQHFLIPENNLLTGCMTEIQRGRLLGIIDNLLKSDGQLLFEIEINNIGTRLKTKLNMIPYCPKLASATDISEMISSILVIDTARDLSHYFNVLLNRIKDGMLGGPEFLLLTLLVLNTKRGGDNSYIQTASEQLIPLVSSTLGSTLACLALTFQTPVPEGVFTYLEAGKDSDVLSGRLKLASVLYCTGDMERAEHELRISQNQYNIALVDFVCECYSMERPLFEVNFLKACDAYNEEAIKSNIAFCTKFLPCEINCVPNELRYEILRSYIEEDRQVRTWNDSQWMDFIVVDSVTYLYFLQYKTYEHLQRNDEAEDAINNLADSIKDEWNLSHKETALNLLGQCFEQADMQLEAFQCYIDSLKHRSRNNAARFLLCIQLFNLWKQENTQ